MGDELYDWPSEQEIEDYEREQARPEAKLTEEECERITEEWLKYAVNLEWRSE